MDRRVLISEEIGNAHAHASYYLRRFCIIETKNDRNGFGHELHVPGVLQRDAEWGPKMGHFGEGAHRCSRWLRAAKENRTAAESRKKVLEWTFFSRSR
jgi:hypothetical protein